MVYLKMPIGWDLELFKAALNLALLLITWTLGKSLLSYWEDRQRIRKASLELRQDFHSAYGEFRSLVQMWKIGGKPARTEDCPDLVREAVYAEGRLEALLTNVSSLKRLDPDEITILGLFRQGYQTIRQAITKGEVEEVPHNYHQPEYQLFNDLMTAVSMLVIAHDRQPSDNQARSNLAQIRDVRSLEWKEAVKLKDAQASWKSLIQQVTRMRLKRR